MSTQKKQEYPNWKYLTSIVVFALIVSHPFFAYLFTEGNEIESQMSEKSEVIINQSINNSETVKLIILWEKEQFNFPDINHFDDIVHKYYLRKFINIPGYYLYINRANCGELATVFEDMANKTNLTYRSIVIDNMLNTKSMKMNNHRFSEVLLENGSWMVADVGFNFYPPKSSKYEFIDRGFLIGNVAIKHNNGTFTDCTSSYVNNTSNIMIHAKKDGIPLEGADVKIELIHENLTSHFTNSNIVSYETNKSGARKLTVGLYDKCSYKITVIDSLYKNSTTIVPEEENASVDIEVDKFNWLSIFTIVLII